MSRFNGEGRRLKAILEEKESAWEAHTVCLKEGVAKSHTGLPGDP